MNKFIKITILVLLLQVALFSKEIGTITAYNEKAVVIRETKEVTVFLGMKLQEHDKIITDKKSKVQIVFNDDTIITIGKNSEFAIEEYLFEENKEPSLKFGLIQGAIRTITGKIGKIAPEKFKVKTKTATIGIRGTNFTIVQKANEIGAVYCTFGAISVSINGFENIVKQGFYAKIIENTVEVKAFTPKDLKALKKENFVDKKPRKSQVKPKHLAKMKLQSDRQIDTTKGSIKAYRIVKKIAQNVQDAKQADEEEYFDVHVNQVTTQKDKEEVKESIADTIEFSELIGRFVTNTISVNTTNSHVYLNYKEESTLSNKLSVYLNSSNGMSELWNLYIAKPKSIVSKENYTTTFSSADLNVFNTDKTSSNPRISSGKFRAVDDDLVSGDAVVWGDWETTILYDNNKGANQEHNIAGLWIAGEKTQSSVVDALTGSEVSYKGIYKAIEYVNTNLKLVSGAANMIVDFGANTAFLTIDYSNGRVYDMYFTSNTNEMGGYQRGDEYGYANALFYGATGSLIGGNFSSTKDGYDKVELKGVYEVALNETTTPVNTSSIRNGWLIDYTTKNYANHLEYSLSANEKFISNDSSLAISSIRSSSGYDDYWELRFREAPTSYVSSEKFEAVFDSVYMVPASGSSSVNAEVTRGVFSATGDDLAKDDYMSWGYWNASLSYENEEGVQSHEVSGYWQTGEKTPDGVVTAITSTDVTYDGIYRAVDFTTQFNNIVNGKASMNVDFGADRATLNIDYGNGRVFDMSVTDNIVSGSEHIGSGEAYGTFYGPNAESIGGNFSTTIDSVKELRGVYQVTK